MFVKQWVRQFVSDSSCKMSVMKWKLDRLSTRWVQRWTVPVLCRQHCDSLRAGTNFKEVRFLSRDESLTQASVLRRLLIIFWGGKQCFCSGEKENKCPNFSHTDVILVCGSVLWIFLQNRIKTWRLDPGFLYSHWTLLSLYWWTAQTLRVQKKASHIFCVRTVHMIVSVVRFLEFKQKSKIYCHVVTQKSNHRVKMKPKRGHAPQVFGCGFFFPFWKRF